jgi:hypothetical protein
MCSLCCVTAARLAQRFRASSQGACLVSIRHPSKQALRAPPSQRDSDSRILCPHFVNWEFSTAPWEIAVPRSQERGQALASERADFNAGSRARVFRATRSSPVTCSKISACSNITRVQLATPEPRWYLAPLRPGEPAAVYAVLRCASTSSYARTDERRIRLSCRTRESWPSGGSEAAACPSAVLPLSMV